MRCRSSGHFSHRRGRAMKYSLGAIPPICLLDPSQRSFAEERAHVLRLRRGQSVIEHGSRCTEVFILAEGRLRVLLFSMDGREVSIRTLAPGGMVGELAAIDGLPRSATVVATAPSIVVSISREDFQRYLATSARVAQWLARQFAGQIRTLTERIFELSTLNVRNRLHCELLRLALLNGAVGQRSTITDAPTHVELANRIGTHREAVTRELRDLARRGIVEQRRREITILDLTKLSSEVHRLSGRDLGIFPTQELSRGLPQSLSV
jgi:CRP/FNR family cyclic AMP-dependent transcriptional regulator